MQIEGKSIEDLPEVCLRQIDKVIEALQNYNAWYGVYVCTSILEKYPLCLDLRQLLRRCQMEVYSVPLTHWEKVQSFGDSWFSCGVQLMRGQVLLKRGQFLEVLSKSEYILNENPYFIPALKLQAKAAYELGSVPIQIFAYECMLRIKQDPKIMLELTKAYIEEGRLEEAQNTAQAILEKEPNLLEAIALFKKAEVLKVKTCMQRL